MSVKNLVNKRKNDCFLYRNIIDEAVEFESSQIYHSVLLVCTYFATELVDCMILCDIVKNL